MQQRRGKIVCRENRERKIPLLEKLGRQDSKGKRFERKRKEEKKTRN